jgi:signal transduction histidine kinase
VTTSGESVTVYVDPDQVEQMLINLVKNAIDAAAETAGEVWVSWRDESNAVRLEVIDSGPGISNPDNLFVPFFTTKPGGTGVGLVLCQQIAEAHGGTLSLVNRSDASGCVATVELPATT